MKIREPKVKVGDIVKCPADRGYSEYTGKVISVDINLATHLDKVFYWVVVAGPGFQTKSVWPDHRLIRY